MRILVITGLPASGKTTLARQLARRYRVALLAKDCFKEPLFDALGAGDAAHSRRLSDISYEILFNVARELANAGTDFILEGNFRRGEHEVRQRSHRSVRCGIRALRLTTGRRLQKTRADPRPGCVSRALERMQAGLSKRL